MTVMERPLDAVLLLLSVTVTVKLEVAAVVGVPVMLPEVLSDRPPGRLPEVTLQEYPPLPPEAAREAE